MITFIHSIKHFLPAIDFYIIYFFIGIKGIFFSFYLPCKVRALVFCWYSINSPFHTISGRIEFKYSDNVSKEDIYSEIQNKLQVPEYELEASISNNGYIDLNENDIPHLQKIVSDHYSHILSIQRRQLRDHLKVGFSSGNELQKLKQQ